MQSARLIEIVNPSKNTVVGSSIRVATTAWSRLVGLLGEAGLDPGGGLLIVPSSGVHTWGMRFPIDVVALDGRMRVLGIWERLGSCRIAALGWKTRSVLELPAGTIRRSQIAVNDQLVITPTIRTDGPDRGQPLASVRVDDGSRVVDRRNAMAVDWVAEPLGAAYRMRPVRRAERAQTSIGLLVLAFFCLVFSCYYAFMIVPPAAALRGPGIVPDLYPAWYASRMVLLHHQDPYSPDVTGRIQSAMYAGKLASRNEQRFAYPIFAVLLFAPFAALSFAAAQACFLALSVALTVWSVFAWLGRSTPPMQTAICAILVMSAFPVMLGLELRQPTMLVAALLAATVACLRSGQLSFAGVLAALTTVKPQLAIGVLLPLLLWSISDWRRRKIFPFSLGLTMAGLLSISEFLSHGWLLHWLTTIQAYAHYAGAKPLICVLPGSRLPMLAGALLIAAAVAASWKWRRADPVLAIGFSVSVFQVLLPLQLYNEVMLLPAVLWTFVQASRQTSNLHTLLRWSVWGLLGAGWLTTCLICVARLISPPSIDTLWSLPMVLAWLFPFALLAHMGACVSGKLPADTIHLTSASPGSNLGMQLRTQHLPTLDGALQRSRLQPLLETEQISQNQAREAPRA